MEVRSELFRGKIVSHYESVKDHYSLSVTAPAVFQRALPGQFVMVRIAGRNVPFLFRPFSIYSAYGQGNRTFLELLYKVRGAGTKMLSCLREGDELDVLGPLGNGFTLPSRGTKIVLVAGGIGVVPLSFLAEWVRGKTSVGDREIICYVGVRSSGLLAGRERLEKISSQVLIATDDGSEGYSGPVTELVARDVHRYRRDGAPIYCCGPRVMLKEMADILADDAVFCQVSMEERMACGVGACLGCAVKVKPGEGEGTYMRVCKEGPVFDIQAIDWS